MRRENDRARESLFHEAVVERVATVVSMGVPAFFKWLSTKYPKIILDCVEQRATWTDDGTHVPVDTSQANPNGVEFEYAQHA